MFLKLIKWIISQKINVIGLKAITVLYISSLTDHFLKKYINDQIYILTQDIQGVPPKKLTSFKMRISE